MIHHVFIFRFILSSISYKIERQVMSGSLIFFLSNMSKPRKLEKVLGDYLKAWIENVNAIYRRSHIGFGYKDH